MDTPILPPFYVAGTAADLFFAAEDAGVPEVALVDGREIIRDWRGSSDQRYGERSAMAGVSAYSTRYGGRYDR